MKALLRVDPAGFTDALRRGHYRELRRQREPVWREYEFRGFRVTHDIRHKSQWNAFARDVHQPGVTHWLRKLCPEGGHALDIGANAGVLTLELARKVGVAGTVHAFEPNPEAYGLLAWAIEDNRIDSYVHVHAFALGPEDQTLTLAVPAANNGAASLRAVEAGERALEVAVRSFDAWWQAEGEPRVDVVKLDVEGFEARVVEALTGMLERDRPALVMELSPSRYDGQALLDCLDGLGYRVMRIVSVPPYAEPLPATLAEQMDIVCFREGDAP